MFQFHPKTGENWKFRFLRLLWWVFWGNVLVVTVGLMFDALVVGHIEWHKYPYAIIGTTAGLSIGLGLRFFVFTPSSSGP